MSSGKSHHVVPSPGGGWDGKRSGAKRATKHFDTKKKAVDHMRRVSRRQGTELFVHKQDGTIEKRDSHGNDPRSQPG
jgi:hypothetical protein